MVRRTRLALKPSQIVVQSGGPDWTRGANGANLKMAHLYGATTCKRTRCIVPEPDVKVHGTPSERRHWTHMSRNPLAKGEWTPALREVVDTAKSILDAARYPMTARQVYYALVAAGVIPKGTSSEGTLDWALGEARERGIIEWDRIEDRTRSALGHDARYLTTIKDALVYARDHATDHYGRGRRLGQTYVQLWAESESIASVMYRLAADEYGIETFPTHGQSSKVFLWNAAGKIADALRDGSEVQLYQVGDLDWGGHAITTSTDARLLRYVTARLRGISASEVGQPQLLPGMRFERIALTWEQVEEWRLEPFNGKVEAEAIPLDTLHGLLRAKLDAVTDKRLEVIVMNNESRGDRIIRDIASKWRVGPKLPS